MRLHRPRAGDTGSRSDHTLFIDVIIFNVGTLGLSGLFPFESYKICAAITSKEVIILIASAASRLIMISTISPFFYLVLNENKFNLAWDIV